MGRKWASREAESNLFEFGERERQRANAAEARAKVLQEALKQANEENAQNYLHRCEARKRVEELEAAINEVINELWYMERSFAVTRLQQALKGGR